MHKYSANTAANTTAVNTGLSKSLNQENLFLHILKHQQSKIASKAPIIPSLRFAYKGLSNDLAPNMVLIMKSVRVNR
jgi:hypothetical protein